MGLSSRDEDCFRHIWAMPRSRVVGQEYPASKRYTREIALHRLPHVDPLGAIDGTEGTKLSVALPPVQIRSRHMTYGSYRFDRPLERLDMCAARCLHVARPHLVEGARIQPADFAVRCSPSLAARAIGARCTCRHRHEGHGSKIQDFFGLTGCWCDRRFPWVSTCRGRRAPGRPRPYLGTIGHNRTAQNLDRLAGAPRRSRILENSPRPSSSSLAWGGALRLPRHRDSVRPEQQDARRRLRGRDYDLG